MTSALLLCIRKFPYNMSITRTTTNFRCNRLYSVNSIFVYYAFIMTDLNNHVMGTK